MNKKTAGIIEVAQMDQYFGVEVARNSEIFHQLKKEKRYWRLACVAFAGIALLSIAAIAAMLPLKRVEPYLVKVDKNTGSVEVIRPDDKQDMKGEASLAEHFINIYLNAREQYRFDRRMLDYEIVRRFSSESILDDYRQWYYPQNSKSPLLLYGRNKTVSCDVRHISMLDEDTAIIHLQRKIKDTNATHESNWVVTMSFQWTMRPEKEEDRFLNPFGFQVTQYRKAPDRLFGKAQVEGKLTRNNPELGKIIRDQGL